MEGVNETLVSEPTSANLLYPSNVSVHAKVKKILSIPHCELEL